MAIPARAERRRRIREAALRGERGRHWYDDAHAEIRKVARAWGVDPVLVAVAVAATSPATPVIASPRMKRGGGSASNIGKARRVVKALAGGHPLPIKPKAPGASRLYDFEDCRKCGRSSTSCMHTSFPEPDSTKTHAFVRNLLGDLNAVTVDTLIGRGVGLPAVGKEGRISITKARYRMIVLDIRAVAKQLGWRPAEVMAAAWTGWGGSGSLTLATSRESARSARSSVAGYHGHSYPAPRLRTNGTRAALVAHLTGRCGMDPKEAERIAPRSESQQSSRHALTPQQLSAFEAGVRKWVKDPAVAAILLVLPVTGMRVSEACTMRLSAMGVGGKRGRLSAEVLGKAKGGRPQIGKNGRGPNGERIVFDAKAKVINGRNIGRMVDAQGKPVKAPPQKRTVPMGRHGTAIIEAWLRKRPRSPHDRVFVGANGGKITPAMVQSACKMVAGRLGIAGLTPHVLRHCYVSQAVAKCWDLQRLREVIGHGKKDAAGRSTGSRRLPAVTLLYIDDKALEDARRRASTSATPAATRAE